MPFCPSCRYEYRVGIAECPDCRVKLVDRLPDQPEKEPEADSRYQDWIPLAVMTAPQYAEMVAEALRGKEIPVVVLSSTGHFGATGQFGTGSFRPVGGAYTVAVPREFAADADAIGELLLGEEWLTARTSEPDRS